MIETLSIWSSFFVWRILPIVVIAVCVALGIAWFVTRRYIRKMNELQEGRAYICGICGRHRHEEGVIDEEVGECCPEHYTMEDL